MWLLAQTAFSPQHGRAAKLTENRRKKEYLAMRVASERRETKVKNKSISSAMTGDCLVPVQGTKKNVEEGAG